MLEEYTTTRSCKYQGINMNYTGGSSSNDEEDEEDEEDEGDD